MAWPMEHYKENLEKRLNENLPKELKDFTFTLKDPSTRGCGDAMQFIASSVERQDYFSAIMQQYSACCAFEQLNHFAYSRNSDFLVGPVINHYIRTLREYYRSGFAKKVILNTVQTPDLNDRPSGFLSQKDVSNGREHMYPAVYKWATGFEHVDIPVTNHNTGRIMHHIITFPITKL